MASEGSTGVIAGHPPKVAIVVPVYNPGPYLDQCVTSLLAQTMPAGELEVVFVDDGSTDGSGGTLDALAAAHSHVRVIHEPNSGWASRPRNVGIDAATADYVLFVDADDRLGAEACERLYARAVQDGSDVVLGRSVGHGRPNPSQRSWVSRGPVRFEDAPEVAEHLKPHKLIRRAFLNEHGIRFPEGKRRLEDQAFILEAYFLADAISVVGDYVCYHHEVRSDRGGLAAQPVSPATYYGFVRENIEIVERYTSPGSFRNRILERLVSGPMLRRLSGPKFLRANPERREALLREIGSILNESIPLDVDAALSPAFHATATLARAGRMDLLMEMAQAGVRSRAAVRVSGAEWQPAVGLVLDMMLSMQPVPDGITIAPDPSGGWQLHVPERVAEVVPPEHLRTSVPIESVIDVLAEDSGNILTSLPAEMSFVSVPGQAEAPAWRVRISATVPFDVVWSGSKRARRRSRPTGRNPHAATMAVRAWIAATLHDVEILARVRFTPDRRRVAVTVDPGVKLVPLRVLPPGGTGQGVVVTPRRRAGGTFAIEVSTGGLGDRAMATAARGVWRVARRVWLATGGRR